MHLLAERFILWAWWSGFSERGSEDLANGTDFSSYLASCYSVFTSIVCTSKHPSRLYFYKFCVMSVSSWIVNVRSPHPIFQLKLISIVNHKSQQFRVFFSYPSLFSTYRLRARRRTPWRTLLRRRVGSRRPTSSTRVRTTICTVRRLASKRWATTAAERRRQGRGGTRRQRGRRSGSWRSSGISWRDQEEVRIIHRVKSISELLKSYGTSKRKSVSNELKSYAVCYFDTRYCTLFCYLSFHCWTSHNLKLFFFCLPSILLISFLNMQGNKLKNNKPLLAVFLHL